MACNGSGGSKDQAECQEELAPDGRSCEAELYNLVPVAELLADPLDWIGLRVETAGMADWYHPEGESGDCACTDGLCSCPTPLGLRSLACPNLGVVPLTGSYQGRPVECSSSGCWPLQPLLSYAVCGTWSPAQAFDTQSAGRLELERFFERRGER